MKGLILTASVTLSAWCLGQLAPLNAQRIAEPQLSNAEREEAARRVMAIADEFVAETFAHYPARYPAASGRDGELGDNSLAALLRWQQKEDGWIESLRTLDGGRPVGTPAWVVYGTLRERLEALRDRRICREELWRISGQDHWLTRLPALAAQQPVGTPGSRTSAIARFRMVSRYLDTEIDNLRRGLQEGYSTPKIIVQRNVRQLDVLSSQAPEESPFFGPARRDSTPEFVTQWRALVTDEIMPAVIRYRNFLRDEYLAAARESASISAHPNGAACFRALVRDYTSLPDSPEDLYTKYVRRLDEQANVTVGSIPSSAGKGEVKKQIQDLVARPASRFVSREDVIPAAEALVKRFEAELPKIFSRPPAQRLVVRLTPGFREEGASGGFYAGKGVMQINPRNAMEPGGKLRLEATVFHEGGHHVQASLTSGRAQIHRALAMLRQPVFNEGWGDYVAQLAYEQGLFSPDGARVFQYAITGGHASDVTQLGLHLKGWTRAQAADFLSQYTVRTPENIASALNRRTEFPADTLAYSAGKIHILELRDRAKQALGSRFDLREFHDRVLEYGSVTLPMLTEMIDRWIASKRTP